ncbi:hypothetical protein FCM35_KLT04898 [Carex littledalei]|uniref:F-box domain-containing protein n=1 Tax=Carex littledalei TaxID=544730 RepID=A0A833QZC6_9POAL|nr:hypothetical protein FCM35_KLT04898 [Carex littledalei]
MANQEEPLHTAEQLNNDAIKKILMRVPATSLLRYQLVCKNWWAMIQEPQFKKDHFKLNNMTNGPLRLLVVKGRVRTGVFCEKSMPVDVESQQRKIWMPRVLGNDGHFAGSCNGLLCTEVKGEITVFNPITREVVYLPKPTYITGYGSNENEKMYTDFFFHSATDEYKVLLFHRKHPTMLWSVNMYTLGANSSWRQVDEISDMPSNSGVNVEDTIYWPYFSEDYSRAIISFNLSEEKINLVYPPIEDAKLVGVTKWHGELCGVSFQREHGIQYGRIKIWILDAGGLWTMRYEVHLQANGIVRLLAPFSIIMNRVFFVISKSTLICHDMSGNGGDIGVQYGYLDSTCQIKNCFAYVESLLPVPK